MDQVQATSEAQIALKKLSVEEQLQDKAAGRLGWSQWPALLIGIVMVVQGYLQLRSLESNVAAAIVSLVVGVYFVSSFEIRRLHSRIDALNKIVDAKNQN